MDSDSFLSGALCILTGQQVEDGRQEGIVLVGQILHAEGLFDPEADGDGDEEEAAQEARTQAQESGDYLYCRRVEYR